MCALLCFVFFAVLLVYLCYCLMHGILAFVLKVLPSVASSLSLSLSLSFSLFVTGFSFCSIPLCLLSLLVCSWLSEGLVDVLESVKLDLTF